MRDPAFGMTFTNQRTDVAASGDLAYSRGQYVMRWTENGQVQTQHGSYIKVWQRQPDGRWKAAEELTSHGPRPPPTM